MVSTPNFCIFRLTKGSFLDSFLTDKNFERGQLPIPTPRTVDTTSLYFSNGSSDSDLHPVPLLRAVSVQVLLFSNKYGY